MSIRRPPIGDLLAPGAPRPPMLLHETEERVDERRFVPESAGDDGHPAVHVPGNPSLAPSPPGARTASETLRRLTDERWLEHSCWQPFPSVPVHAARGAPFVRIDQRDLVDIGAGVQAVDGEDVYLAFDNDDPAFRVRTSLGTRLVEVVGGRMLVYDDPADMEPWAEPPLRAWLFDRSIPEWLEPAVAARCAIGTAYHAFCGVGLCLRHAALSRRPSLEATLEAVRSGRRPALHERVTAWVGQPHVRKGLSEVAPTALHLAQTLAERLDNLDREGLPDPELAVAFMTDRDDLESAKALLRLEDPAESLDEILVEVDEVGEAVALLLEEALVGQRERDPVLSAAAREDDRAWWGWRGDSHCPEGDRASGAEPCPSRGPKGAK